MSKRRRIVAKNPQEEGSAPEVVASSGAPQPISRMQWETIPELLFVKLQQEDEDKVTDALNTLSELMTPAVCRQADENTEEAIRLGAHALVLVAMRKYPHNQDLQEEGCGCLMAFLFNGNLSSAIVQSGGLETVVNALSSFPENAGVQSEGIATLMNLFHKLDSAQEEVQLCASRFVNELNGLELIVAAMKEFSNDADILQNCCALFSNLAVHEEFEDRIKAAGGVSAVAVVFEKHANHPDIRNMATSFMKKVFH